MKAQAMVVVILACVANLTGTSVISTLVKIGVHNLVALHQLLQSLSKLVIVSNQKRILFI
jgi:hypothetical protein